MPIFLSLVLTSFIPEKRIVPALYINLIAFGWILVFGYNHFNLSTVAATYTFVFFYATLGGVLQDKLVARIVGVAVPED